LNSEDYLLLSLEPLHFRIPATTSCAPTSFSKVEIVTFMTQQIAENPTCSLKMLSWVKMISQDYSETIVY
jgi:hypothetical protein